jgi:hypothetical protein
MEEISTLLQAIRAYCQQNSAYEAGGGSGRAWMLPPRNGWSGNPLEIGELHKPFNRTNLAIKHAAALQLNNMGHLGSITLQIGYIAMMERSFRARHMTSVRAAAHATGRKTAHAHPAGIHTGGVLRYIENEYAAGSAGS